jgi:Flp pilus assembly protein TadG
MNHHTRDEHGQVTALWAVLSLALFVLGGLVYDGGQILTARRDANNLARQAARAGAQELDENAIRAGTPTLDPAAAEIAARGHLAQHGRGATPTAITVNAATVTVTVTRTQPTPLLAVVGIDERTVTATASARSARGVTGDGT